MKTVSICLAFLFVLYQGISYSPLVKTQNTLNTMDDFPCANHGCGCPNAMECQKNCCCFPKNKSRHNLEKIKTHLNYFLQQSCKGANSNHKKIINLTDVKLNIIPNKYVTNIAVSYFKLSNFAYTHKPFYSMSSPPG